MRARTKATPADERGRIFEPPLTISHSALLEEDGDRDFRATVFSMVTALNRLLTCRDAFGRAVNLTGSQFAVLMGVAYTQGELGVPIRRLSDHVQLAATHVTTEVGRLCRRGLLAKTENADDKRSVLVRLTEAGEQSVRDLAPYMRSVNDVLFEGVSRAEFSQLKTFLSRFNKQSARAIEMIRNGKPVSRTGVGKSATEVRRRVGRR